MNLNRTEEFAYYEFLKPILESTFYATSCSIVVQIQRSTRYCQQSTRSRNKNHIIVGQKMLYNSPKYASARRTRALLLFFPVIKTKLVSLAIYTHMLTAQLQVRVFKVKEYNSWGGLRSPGKHMSVEQNVNETNVIMNKLFYWPIQHSIRAHGEVLTTSGGSTPMFKHKTRATLTVFIWNEIVKR